MTTLLTATKGNRVRDLFRSHDALLMVVLVAALWTVQMVWAWYGGERIPVRDGAGFDGGDYAAITADPGMILRGEVSTHRIQRILPSLLAWALLAPWGQHGNVDAVVATYQVLNLMALVGCLVLWYAVCRRLQLSRAAGWVGATALVINYPALKLSVFYAVLTDRFALLLGMAMVWALVLNRAGGLLVVALLGAFTWPTVTYAALVLFVLSRRVDRPERAPRWWSWWGITVAVVATALAVWLSVAAHACGYPCVHINMVRATIEELYPLSVVLFALVMFFAVQPVAARLPPLETLRAFSWQRLLIAAGLLLVLAWLHRSFSTVNHHTLGRTLDNTYLGAAVKPLGFLVMHVAYYGPALLVVLAWWRRCVGALGRLGPGALAVLLAFVMLGFSTESRVLVNQWALFALGAALVVHDRRWRMPQAIGLLLLSVVVSRFWLRLHRGPIGMDWESFPGQWYFMSNGHTTTPVMYLALTAAVGVSAAALWLLDRSAKGVGRDSRAS